MNDTVDQTTPRPVAREAISVRRLATAGAAALVADLAVFAVATSSGASMEVTSPSPMQVTAPLVAVATVLPLLAAGAGLAALTRHWPSVRRWAGPAGLAVGLVTAASPLLAAADRPTGLALATMHAVVGVAWFVGLRGRPKP